MAPLSLARSLFLSRALSLSRSLLHGCSLTSLLDSATAPESFNVSPVQACYTSRAFCCHSVEPARVPVIQQDGRRMAAMDGIKELVQTQTDVALRLTRQLLLGQAAGSNAVFSPLSLHVLLSMLAAGTAGPERERLLSFLKVPSTTKLHAFASQILGALFVNHLTNSKGPRLTAANGVWIDKSLTFKPAFKAVMDMVYQAGTNNLDFENKPEEALEEVNAWAEEETNGLIKDALFPGKISRQTLIILANVLYFKAAWHSQFERLATKCDDFHRLDGSSIRVPFMRGSGHRWISIHDGFKILALDYNRCSIDEERRFRMYFLLPDATDGLPALVDRACSETGFLDRHRPRHMAGVKKLRIPKFKISLRLSASSMLSKMGLVLPCITEMAELGPALADDLRMPNMIQKAVIEIDEKGTEAAAFSACAQGVRCMQRIEHHLLDFVADHPFMFLICEENTGIVLFTGQVLDPLARGGL